MKFITAQDKTRINLDQVKFFFADKQGRVFAVFDAKMLNNGAVAGYFERLVGEFGTQTEAQKWLDLLLDEVTT